MFWRSSVEENKFGRLLLIFGSIYVAYRTQQFLPTKDAVATMFLSKQWQFIWTMVPTLEYKEINTGTHKSFLPGLVGRLFGRSRSQSIQRFLDNSLQLHKAHVLEILIIELNRECPVDVDVGKCIANAVDRKVRELEVNLTWSIELISLPTSLYTCDTLVYMSLSDKIFVDVPSTVCFPSLKYLYLLRVVYKDDDSLARLLSNCPILKLLHVNRHDQDNVRNCSIKVPSLEILWYNYLGVYFLEGSLVIDTPNLKNIAIADNSLNSCSIVNNPSFDEAGINVLCYPDDKVMRSLSSAMYLELILSTETVECCNTINFSQLMECKLAPTRDLDWLEPLMLLLRNSPNLKVLFIDMMLTQLKDDFPLTWNQPSSVPECLSTHLEILKWKGYGGRSEERKKS